MQIYNRANLAKLHNVEVTTVILNRNKIHKVTNAKLYINGEYY